MATPPIIKGRPSTSACTSKPCPTRNGKLIAAPKNPGFGRLGPAAVLPCRPIAGYSHFSIRLKSSGQVTLKFRAEPGTRQIGRASSRERVCQYVSISVVAVSLKKKKKITQNYRK